MEIKHLENQLKAEEKIEKVSRYEKYHKSATFNRNINYLMTVC